MAKQFSCTSPDELASIAKELILEHQDKRVFAFHGAMGAGKTTFIKAICAVLGVTDPVNSPTFAIINEYFTSDEQSVYHFDFYRIKHPQEAYDIGYEHYFFSGNYCFIEWPEKIAELLPENCVYVKIEETGAYEERLISF